MDGFPEPVAAGRRRPWFRGVLPRAIGISILVLVLWRVGLSALVEQLGRLGFWSACLALGLSIPHLACKSERWRRMLHAAGIRVPVSHAFGAYLAGIAMGAFTPGRAGEFFRAWLPARRFGAPVAASLATVIADRVFDLAFLLLVSGLAAAWMWGHPASMALFFAALAAGFFFQRPAARWLHRLLSRLPLPKDGMQTFWDAWSESMRFWPLLALWTLAGYAFMNLQVYVMAWSMGVPIGFGELFLLFGLANTVALLPVSVLGLGTREAVLGMLFVARGYQQTQGVSLALAFFVIGSIPVVAAGAFWLLVQRSSDAPLVDGGTKT